MAGQCLPQLAQHRTPPVPQHQQRQQAFPHHGPAAAWHTATPLPQHHQQQRHCQPARAASAGSRNTSSTRRRWQLPPLRAAAGSDSGSSDSSSTSRSSSSSSSGGTGGPLGWLRRWQQEGKQMQHQLKALGAAGVLAYGLLNTLYYSVAFVCFWFGMANVDSGLGWSAAGRKAAEVFALVWAGSQVTKLLRAGAALALAPLIDRGLDRLGLQDKSKVYLLIVAGCVVLATAVIGTVIALHA